MRVLVAGAKGRMGTVVSVGVERASDLELVARVDLGDDLAALLASAKPDVAIEFTTPETVFFNSRAILEAGAHCVVGTTGLTQEQRTELDTLAREKGCGCLVAPNFSVGAVLMMRFAAEAARYMPWAEVVERHHERKLDAPSGTARLTAELIAAARSEAPAPEHEEETAPGARGGRVDEVPVHSLRLPGSVAHQDVWFGAPGETLVLRHDVIDREAFVPGVLLAVRRIGEHKGLLVGLENLL
ncbi:MAG: 4-hydroxy-tetrahydrodipicolinate reductase [Planctomycetota bacterium]|nr:4-hydroxy-tetrahydrodipicolinate reductase [Planctomycetota bacterium]